VSASTRNRLATIYPYEGRNEGGFVTAEYGSARGTFWCRFSPIPGSESMIDAQAGVMARATIAFHDEVPIAENDLIVMDDNVQWKAGPITARRAQRENILVVERSNEMPELVTADSAPSGDVDGGDSDDSQTSSIDGGGADAVFTATIDGGGA
jgi:hypothetical protein